MGDFFIREGIEVNAEIAIDFYTKCTDGSLAIDWEIEKSQETGVSREWKVLGEIAMDV